MQCIITCVLGLCVRMLMLIECVSSSHDATGPHTHQISELMASSSKGGGRQGHMNIPMHVGYDELVQQLQLYAVAPPPTLEADFHESSTTLSSSSSSGGGSDGAGGLVQASKFGGDHLQTDQTITVDALLEIARKTLVSFVDEKRHELKGTFQHYARRSTKTTEDPTAGDGADADGAAGGGDGAEEGDGGGDSEGGGELLRTVSVSFAEFVDMVETIDEGRHPTAGAAGLHRKHAAATAAASSSSSSVQGGRDMSDVGKSRSHHELVEMYGIAIGQQHDDDDVFDLDALEGEGGEATTGARTHT
jgi:hypothetical protein